MIEISKTKNKNPLPQIKYHSSIKLPPDRFCLHGANYTLKSEKRPIAAPLVSYFFLSNQTKILNFKTFKIKIKQTSLFANNKPILQQQSSSTSISNNQTNINSPSNLNTFQGIQVKRRRDDDEDYDI